MPALQKKHKKSSVHNIKSVMNTRYGCGDTQHRLPAIFSRNPFYVHIKHLSAVFHAVLLSNVATICAFSIEYPSR